MIAETKIQPSSVYVLLASNALTIALALLYNWELGTVLWIYWWQSIIIGFSTALKMLTAKVHGMSHGLMYAQVGFFIVHYGFFHFIYAIFLWQMFGGDVAIVNANITVGILIFLLDHTYSFIKNFFLKERLIPHGQQAFRRMMFAPYKRIVPMHLIIIFGGLIATYFPGLHNAVLIAFLLLKTGVDALAHVMEHRRRATL